MKCESPFGLGWSYVTVILRCHNGVATQAQLGEKPQNKKTSLAHFMKPSINVTYVTLSGQRAVRVLIIDSCGFQYETIVATPNLALDYIEGLDYPVFMELRGSSCPSYV